MYKTTYQVTWKEQSGTCKCIHEETFMYRLRVSVSDHPDLNNNRRNYWRASFEPRNHKYFAKNPPIVRDSGHSLGFSTVEEAIESATEEMKLFIEKLNK